MKTPRPLKYMLIAIAIPVAAAIVGALAYMAWIGTYVGGAH